MFKERCDFFSVLLNSNWQTPKKLKNKKKPIECVVKKKLTKILKSIVFLLKLSHTIYKIIHWKYKNDIRFKID